MTEPAPFAERVTVTRPALPPLRDYTRGLEEIWRRRQLTNNGPVVERFRSRLSSLLGTPELALFSNGTLALEAAFTGLRLDGEVITTPFTFPATTNAIARCGLTAVFADVEPTHLTLDPAAVEAAITSRTSGILAVHVYGNPARLGELAAISERHSLTLMYDAAHAFGTRIGGRSIAQFGDVSMFSFHATKPFQSAEGGALVCKDRAVIERAREFANHGLTERGAVDVPGSNAKMSELHALLGELLLDGLEERRLAYKRIAQRYRQLLDEVPGLEFLPEVAPDVEPSFAFLPILVDRAGFGFSAMELQSELELFNVETRRYFAPLLADLEAFRSFRAADSLEIARRAAEQVLTLPIYADLPLESVDRIAGMICSISQRARRG